MKAMPSTEATPTTEAMRRTQPTTPWTIDSIGASQGSLDARAMGGKLAPMPATGTRPSRALQTSRTARQENVSLLRAARRILRCGPGNLKSCCDSAALQGGTFGRRFADKVLPATVDAFRLDRYVVRLAAFADSSPPTIVTAPPRTKVRTRTYRTAGGRRCWNDDLPPTEMALRSRLSCPVNTWTKTLGANEQMPIDCVVGSKHSSFAFGTVVACRPTPSGPMRPAAVTRARIRGDRPCPIIRAPYTVAACTRKTGTAGAFGRCRSVPSLRSATALGAILT